MNERIAVVGSLNMDLVIRAPYFPQPGETIIGSHFQTIPGGKGANQAVAAARLGGQVHMVGRVGDDDFANVFLEYLKSVNVDTSLIVRDSQVASGVALIVVDDKGENSIVVAPGANMELTEKDVEASESVIAAADVLILQLEVPLPVVIRAAKIAREHNVKVVLNPAPVQKLPLDLLESIDVLVPNESETELLTGLPVSSDDELARAVRKLLDYGIRSIVITLGERGAYLAGQKIESRIVAGFSVEPVDTTAAGDAFVACLAVNYGAGKSLQEAVKWGNAAGALTTLRFGAQTSLPSREEVLRLLDGENPELIIGRGT